MFLRYLRLKHFITLPQSFRPFDGPDKGELKVLRAEIANIIDFWLETN